MTDRDRLRAQLIRHEGCVLHAYKDSLGFTTLGVGRLIDARKGGGITRDEAEYLLSGDIDRVTRGLFVRFPTWFPQLDPVRQAVIVEMGFQLGLIGLSRFVRTLGAVAEGDYARAATQMLASTWATQTPARARELAAQMTSGVWDGA